MENTTIITPSDSMYLSLHGELRTVILSTGLPFSDSGLRGEKRVHSFVFHLMCTFLSSLIKGSFFGEK
jgi:hypothetical protein